MPAKHIKINIALKKAIIFYLKEKIIPDNFSEVCSKRPADFKRMCKSFEFDSLKKLLFFIDKKGNRLEIYAEEEENHRNIRLLLLHKQYGCAGRDRFFSIVKTSFYGVTKENVMQIIRGCDTCTVVNLERTRQEIQQIKSNYPRERLIADLVDLRKYSEKNDGYGWLFVAVDAFSKNAFTFALMKKDKEEVLNCFKKIIYLLGHVLIIHTDNGKEFQNSLLRNFCEKHKIKKVQGKARRPWVQGQVERFNQTLKSMLGKRMQNDKLGERWIDIYEEITFLYNNMLHHSTRHTPNEVLFGGKLFNKIPVEYRERLLKDDVDENDNAVEEVVRPVITFEPVVDANVEALERLNKRVKENTENKMNRAIKNRNSSIKARLLKIGEKVFIRKSFDANRETKPQPFGEHLDYDVYIIHEVLDNNFYNLIREKDDAIIERVPLKDLKFKN